MITLLSTALPSTVDCKPSPNSACTLRFKVILPTTVSGLMVSSAFVLDSPNTPRSCELPSDSTSTCGAVSPALASIITLALPSKAALLFCTASSCSKPPVTDDNSATSRTSVVAETRKPAAVTDADSPKMVCASALAFKFRSALLPLRTTCKSTSERDDNVTSPLLSRLPCTSTSVSTSASAPPVAGCWVIRE